MKPEACASTVYVGVVAEPRRIQTVGPSDIQADLLLLSTRPRAPDAPADVPDTGDGFPSTAQPQSGLPEESITNKLPRPEFLSLWAPPRPGAKKKKNNNNPYPHSLSPWRWGGHQQQMTISILLSPNPHSHSHRHTTANQRGWTGPLDDTQFWKPTRTEAPFLLP